MVAHPASWSIAMTSHKFQRTTLIWLAVLMLGAFALAGMVTLGARAPLPFSAALDLPVAAGMNPALAAPNAPLPPDAAPAAQPATGVPGATSAPGTLDAADSDSDSDSESESESENALGNVRAGS